jgi:CBS domain-containing protein
MRAFSMSGPVGEKHPRGSVGQVMRTDVVCVPESEGIATLRFLLLERRVGGVPVVRSDGRPVGVVSGADLLRSALEQGGTPPTTAGEIMTREVLALPITASIAQAAALMSYEGVDLIVITDPGGQVAGVVQALDIARWHAKAAGYLVDRVAADLAA